MNDDMKEELNDCYHKIDYLDRLLGDRDDEIERLREALKDIDGQMRQADRYLLKESTLAALQQKDSE